MTPTSTNRLTTFFSTWLLVEGIWGIFNPLVFGFLSTNRLHASIHIVLGLVGLGTAFSGGARKFLWFLGILLLTVGIVYFVPNGQRVTDILAVNEPVAVLNIIIG